MSARSITVQLLQQVIEQKKNLSNLFNNEHILKQAGNEKALVQEMSYGSMRWYIQLVAILDQLIDKPIKPKDSELKYLLIIGLYQLIHMRIAPHAAVSKTVEACSELNKTWAKAFVNAILRRYLRDADKIETSLTDDIKIKNAHPDWLVEQLKQDWPEHWAGIVNANNERPPMYLRVNSIQYSRDEYLEKLKSCDIEASTTAYSEQGILLKSAQDISALPEFDKGAVSVQDLAAQLAINLLDLHSGHNVLDACAAPGGKCAHILETNPDINKLTAIEKDDTRAKRLRATLNRLNLDATIIVDDTLNIEQWWDGKKYDRILLDTPCSATGVIRRHPDIKLLRTETDIQMINELQLALLSKLWGLLNKNGRLLYATCSILKKENQDTIQYFSDKNTDCNVVSIDADWGLDTGFGRQILTGENNMDGFFYACLEKK